MKSTLLSCLAFVFSFAWALESHAIRIKLAAPFKYRKTEYLDFETKDVCLELLVQITEDREYSEPDNVALIRRAIANKQHITHQNVVYFNPPLEYNGRLYYQRYIYSKDPKVIKELGHFLKAAQRSPHQDQYETQIARIRRVLKLRQEHVEEDEEKAPAPRKRVKRDDDEDESWEPAQKSKLEDVAVDHPHEALEDQPLPPANDNAGGQQPMPELGEVPLFTDKELDEYAVFFGDNWGVEELNAYAFPASWLP
jgi:hypothetical protein